MREDPIGLLQDHPRRIGFRVGSGSECPGGGSGGDIGRRESERAGLRFRGGERRADDEGPLHAPGPPRRLRPLRRRHDHSSHLLPRPPPRVRRARRLPHRRRHLRRRQVSRRPGPPPHLPAKDWVRLSLRHRHRLPPRSDNGRWRSRIGFR